MTDNFENKQQYIQYVAEKYNTTPEIVDAISYGEDLVADENLVSNILAEFVSHPTFLYFAMIWKGSLFPGSMVNTDTYEYDGQVFEGLNLFLYKTPYVGQIFLSNGIIGDLDYFQRLVSKRPNCGVVILTAATVQNLRLICKQHDIPAVYVNYPTDMDMTHHYSISTRTGDAMQEVVSHLYNLGHRSIGFIHGTLSLNVGQERLDEYYKAMTAVGLSVNKQWVVAGNWQESSGYEATMKLLSLDDRPTAIIASNDQMAIGAMDAIEAQGLCIPDDVSLVGYDDIALAEQMTPPLSSVRQPMTRIGSKAAEYLIDLLQGTTPEPRHLYLPVEFIIRGSIGIKPQ